MLCSQPVDVLTSMFSLSLSLALSFSLSFLLSLSFSLAFLVSLSGRCLARSRWMCSLPWLTWSPSSSSLWKRLMSHYLTFWKVFLDLPGSLLWGQSNFGDVRILAAPDISLCNFLKKKKYFSTSQVLSDNFLCKVWEEREAALRAEASRWNTQKLLLSLLLFLFLLLKCSEIDTVIVQYICCPVSYINIKLWELWEFKAPAGSKTNRGGEIRSHSFL